MAGMVATRPTETAASKAPSPQNDATLNAREAAVKEEPIGSSRFIETREDAEFVQWVKDGKDLDSLTDEEREELYERPPAFERTAPLRSNPEPITDIDKLGGVL